MAPKITQKLVNTLQTFIQPDTQKWQILFYHLKPSGVSYRMCFKGNELFAVLTAHMTDLHAFINNAVIKKNRWKAVITICEQPAEYHPCLLWLFEGPRPPCAESHQSYALTKTFPSVFLSNRHQRPETLLNICHALLNTPFVLKHKDKHLNC